jgi:Asp-tRNA(Asn)/Glu-tRNA(Gln) amidotransferase A subunit family amidase
VLAFGTHVGDWDDGFPVVPGAGLRVRAPARPVARGPELDEDASRRSVYFTMPFNLGGWPAAQVPWTIDLRGLPLGVQAVGARGDDLRVLDVGAALEWARG